MQSIKRYLPIVTIVGRPNVGKSTFFNRIVGKKRTIIDDIPGVTRDTVYADVEWNGKNFTLVDTGGFDPFIKEDMIVQIREQVQVAIDL